MKNTSPRWLSASLRNALRQFDSGALDETGLSWALLFV